MTLTSNLRPNDAPDPLDSSGRSRRSRPRRDPAAIDAAVAVLRDRAGRLCADADGMHPLVAQAYRRRADELSLAAWVGDVMRGRPTTRRDPCARHAA